jgi:pyruvate/oxaloacetate carboxyltransferase
VRWSDAGQSLYTFELFRTTSWRSNAQVLAKLGVAVLTVYDALNDNRNLSPRPSRPPCRMLVNAMMTYTLSPVHTDAYYVERTKELGAAAG